MNKNKTKNLEDVKLKKGWDAFARGDYATALREWKLYAEQGYARAQTSLGLMYRKGKGVTQDYTLAHMWWNVAASQGDEVARKYRDMVETEMTATQIETAKRLAREYVKESEDNNQ